MLPTKNKWQQRARALRTRYKTLCLAYGLFGSEINRIFANVLDQFLKHAKPQTRTFWPSWGTHLENEIGYSELGTLFWANQPIGKTYRDPWENSFCPRKQRQKSSKIFGNICSRYVPSEIRSFPALRLFFESRKFTLIRLMDCIARIRRPGRPGESHKDATGI